MPLIETTESFPERPVLIILAGTPFSFKTSTAMTASKPLLIDSERGGERAHGRVPTFLINTYAELESEIQGGLLERFDTVITDTVKSFLDDHIWEHALTLAYTKNKQKLFGETGDIFKKFVSKVKAQKKDLVFVSHEKSKDEDDARIYDLDITGGSKQLLLRMADQVGFAYKQQLKTPTGVITQTVITFNPKKEWPFCKNVAGLADIVIPDRYSNEWAGFMDREIIQPTKQAISSMSEDQRKALEIVAQYQDTIDSIAGGDVELKAISEEVKKIEPEGLKKQIKAYLSQHIKSIGWKWNANDKVFEPVFTEPSATEAENAPTDSESNTNGLFADSAK